MKRFAQRGSGHAWLIRCAAGFAIGALASAGHADIFEFQLTLDGGQHVPRVETSARGSGTATLDTDTNEFSWNIEFQDLSSNQTAAHFHGPADLCESAGVQVPLDLGSPSVGSTIVTDEQEQQILEGLWYVNIHTENFPAGEIRGQVEHASIDDPFPVPIEFGSVEVQLETIAVGLTAPSYGTHAPGVPRRLFVTDQPGQIWNINLDTLERTIFADVSDRLVELGAFGPGTFDERGLLGLAFHPDYQSNGLLYTYTSEPFDGTPADFSTMPPDVDPDHQTVIAEWQSVDSSDPDTVLDPDSRRELLRIDQPQFNHNAGTVAFGPDGMLYIALGDGGRADDQGDGHVCVGNGQDISNILGAVLRIDPLGDNSGNGQYGNPADNPFVNQEGLDEIYAFGFRNPFRFSFDTMTGELFLGDAGQNHVEWVHNVVAGGNHGWRIKEGSFAFVPNGDQRGYATTPQFLNRPDIIEPIAEYDHDEGVVIVGGFVYRGTHVPALDGRYVFAEHAPDVAEDKIGRLFYLDDDNAIQELRLRDYDAPMRFLLGFGQDAEGEIYPMGNEVQVPFENTGVVLRIASAFNLTIEPGCPAKNVGFLASGATAGDRVAFIRALNRGSFEIPLGFVCAGTQLGLDRSVVLMGARRADASGVAAIERDIPAAACGRIFVQALNVETCETSDVEMIR